MRWEASITHREMRNGCTVLAGKPEGKILLGIPRHNLEVKIKTDLKENVGDLDWINLAQDRDQWRAVANAVMKLRFP
jgi:hypothetical protein